MDPESSTIQGSNSDNNENVDSGKKIVTPNTVRQEAYPDNTDVVINPDGDTKEAGSNVAQTPDGKEYTPTSNQNEINIGNYEPQINKTQTDTVVTPDNQRIYRNQAGYDQESNQWMKTKDAQEAPKKAQYVSARETTPQERQAREQSVQDLTSGGARRRDSNARFSADPTDAIYVTGDQLEQAKQEMNTALEDKEANLQQIQNHLQTTSSEETNEVTKDDNEAHDTEKFSSEDQKYIEQDLEGESFDESLAELMDEDEAQRYNQTLESGTTEQPQNQPQITPSSEEITQPEDIQSTHAEPINPEELSPEMQRIQELERQLEEMRNELRNIRGENTPEQRSRELEEQIQELDNLAHQRELTLQEKGRYFDLTREKQQIDEGINQEEQESEERRKNKEKWIKLIAGGLGLGTALLTPPAGVAAVVAVTLGGRYAGKGLKHWSEKLRSKSSSLKYEDRRGKTVEQLLKLDREQKRKKWWADRLEEVSAVFLGGSAGYGVGSMFQNIFGWQGVGGNTAEVSGAATAEANPSRASWVNTRSDVVKEATQVGGEVAQQTETLTEGLGDVDHFFASDFNWDYDKLGWLGDKVSVGAQGGRYGLLQREFFDNLMKLVPREGLVGQAKGETINTFLRNAYNGIDPSQAAKNAAAALGY
jgi:hypothetical protein